MAVEMNKSPIVRLTPVQEIQMAKPATELYVGQILKTVVVAALTNNQVTINIHGQNFNANSTHHFYPGDVLEAKVIATQGETILELLPQSSPSSILQSTLLQVLPKQAPATQLLESLNQLMSASNLPSSLIQNIRNTISTIPTLQQLPQILAQAINQSGMFLESNLSNLKPGNKPSTIRGDFKGQCLKLLADLGESASEKIYIPVESKALYLEKDPLPLAGAIPQPLHKDQIINLLELPAATIKSYLKEQVSQVLARIMSSQITHLSQDQNAPYVLMLDLPIKHPEGIDRS